jgi:dolichol kinase
MAEPPSEGNLSYRGEIQRKALHLVALVVPLGMAVLGRATALAVLVPLTLLALLGDVLRVHAPWFRAFIDRWFAVMMRTEEQPPLGGPVVINGATWVLVSATLLAFVFPLRIAVPAFVMFMVADAMAALVGRRYGRLHWGSSPRTVEGSFAFLVTGLAIIAFFPGITFWVGALGVGAACVAEAAPVNINDNLRAPLAAAVVIFALERYVLGIPVALFT